jgi:hypothetical protein
MWAIRREGVECEKTFPLILIKAFRVALGELIRGQGRRRLSNGSGGAVSPTHNSRFR